MLPPPVRFPGIACLAVLVLFALLGALNPSSAQAGCPGAHDPPGSISKNRAAAAVVCVINRVRRAHGVAALKRNDRLDRAADNHTDFMIDAGCFAHTCPGEPSLGRRLDAVGYIQPHLSSWLYAETIGWGARWRAKPLWIVKSWMSSSSHREIVLDRRYEEIGVGAEGESPTGYRRAGTFTADFGLRVP